MRQTSLKNQLSKTIDGKAVHEIIDKYRYGIDRVLLSRLLNLTFSDSETFMRGLMIDEPDTIFINNWSNYITKENLELAIANGEKMEMGIC